MKVVGLTGGIASGKSTVAALLVEKGACVIDADRIATEILKENIEVRQQIASFFGKEVLDSEGEIDRKKLADIVFSNAAHLEFLNKLTHPLIISRIKDEFERKRLTLFNGVVVLNIPLLVEANLLSLADLIVVVTADESVRLKRLKEKSYLLKEAKARMRAQVSDEERFKIADYVIENNGTLQELKGRVDELWKKIVKS